MHCIDRSASVVPSICMQELSDVAGSTTGGFAKGQIYRRPLAASMRDSILTGELSLTECMVLSMRFMPAGPLRPVIMPCCGFTASHAGAQQLVHNGICQLCKTPLLPEVSFEDDVIMLQKILLHPESQCLGPRVVNAEEVVLGKMIGVGGEGTAFSGMFRGMPVAVKRLELPQSITAEIMLHIRNVIAHTHAAGVASQYTYVCKLHGYCWTSSETWCDHLLHDDLC